MRGISATLVRGLVYRLGSAFLGSRSDQRGARLGCPRSPGVSGVDI